MAELKTQPTDQDVVGFLNAVSDERKRQDCFTLLALMAEITQAEPRLWGSIIGFGRYRYAYASGRTGEFFLTGFAPRKQSLTLYIMGGFEHYDELLAALGSHARGKSCLYIKRLSDVDHPTLRELVRQSVAHMRAAHPADG